MQIPKSEESKEHLLATLKAEKEELESSLSKEKMQSVQLKQELAEAEKRNTDLYKVTWYWCGYLIKLFLAKVCLFMYLSYEKMNHKLQFNFR